MYLHYFSWLIAAIGLCVLAYQGLQQRYFYFHLDPTGQGVLESQQRAFCLQAPLLCTPWLLMFAMTQEDQTRGWLFIWFDSVDAAAWSRLRRIARSAAAGIKPVQEQE